MFSEPFWRTLLWTIVGLILLYTGGDTPDWIGGLLIIQITFLLYGVDLIREAIREKS